MECFIYISIKLTTIFEILHLIMLFWCYKYFTIKFLKVFRSVENSDKFWYKILIQILIYLHYSNLSKLQVNLFNKEQVKAAVNYLFY